MAGRQIVPELMQKDFTAERLAAEARRILTDEPARRQMKTDLADVAARLSVDADPMDRAVTAVRALMQRLNKEEPIHV